MNLLSLVLHNAILLPWMGVPKQWMGGSYREWEIYHSEWEDWLPHVMLELLVTKLFLFFDKLPTKALMHCAVTVTCSQRQHDYALSAALFWLTTFPNGIKWHNLTGNLITQRSKVSFNQNFLLCKFVTTKKSHSIYKLQKTCSA